MRAIILFGSILVLTLGGFAHAYGAPSVVVIPNPEEPVKPQPLAETDDSVVNNKKAIVIDFSTGFSDYSAIKKNNPVYNTGTSSNSIIRVNIGSYKKVGGNGGVFEYFFGYQGLELGDGVHIMSKEELVASNYTTTVSTMDGLGVGVAYFVRVVPNVGIGSRVQAYSSGVTTCVGADSYRPELYDQNCRNFKGYNADVDLTVKYYGKSGLSAYLSLLQSYANIRDIGFTGRGVVLGVAYSFKPIFQ